MSSINNASGRCYDIELYQSVQQDQTGCYSISLRVLINQLCSRSTHLRFLIENLITSSVSVQCDFAACQSNNTWCCLSGSGVLARHNPVLHNSLWIEAPVSYYLPPC